MQGTSPWLWTLTLSLVVYATMWPLDHLPGGDSGELVAEACVNGVAHPPGYPLLLSLLRILYGAAQQFCSAANTGQFSIHFVLLANALNVFIAAGAAACVTHAVDLLSGKASPIESTATGLIFALSKLTWEYARGIEVFALNNFLVGMLHLLVIKHFAQPSIVTVCLGAFVCGLGLANQHTIVLFEFPFIVWVLSTFRFSVQSFFCAAIIFLSGLSFYLQTFLAAQQPTPGSWGNASTLAGLFVHIKREEYGTFQLSPLQVNSEGFLLRLKAYVTDCVEDFHWVGIILMCIGVIRIIFLDKNNDEPNQKTFQSWRQRIGYVQISAMVCYLMVFHSLANLPLGSPLPRAISSRFNMQPNLILVVWMGLGLGKVIQSIASQLNTDIKMLKLLRWSISLMLVIAQLRRSMPKGNNVSADVIRNHSVFILDLLPKNSVLLSYTDINWNSIRYLQACEGVRPDVTHLSLQLLPFPWFSRQHSLYPNISFPLIQRGVSTVKNSPGYRKLLQDFFAANIASHGDHLFLDLHAVNDEDIAPNGQYLGFMLTPHGLVWKVRIPPSSAVELDALYSRWKALPRPSVHFTPALYPPGSWEFASSTIANDAYYQGALFELSYWLERGKTIKHAHTAAKYVLGMHDAYQQLAEVEANAIVADGLWGLTYESYDVAKNTALAAMRYSTGLELVPSLLPLLQNHDSRSGVTNQELQELKIQVQYLNKSRHLAVKRVKLLLKRMRQRHDPDIKVFHKFVKSIQKMKT